jgi:hypothetical protein
MPNHVSGRISVDGKVFGELERMVACATERLLDGGKHTYVFTDTVRRCNRVFELVLAGFAELTATPLAK